MNPAHRRIHPAEIARVALVSLFFLAAPTAGDIGGCGQTAEDLDAMKFFDTKQTVDCRRCLECALLTDTCELACGAALPITFPDGCYPLVHDGEVCLDALEVASCDDYQNYMADQGATIPTECNFCPPREAPDAGTDP